MMSKSNPTETLASLESAPPGPPIACAIDLIGDTVVLDTAGPILYLGRLREVRPDGFVLDDADVHDCRDGHAGKELYLCDARRDGVRPNRTSIFVFRETVLSASRLADVIAN